MMQGRKRVIIALSVTVGVIAIGCASMALNFYKKTDQLWNIVSQQCVPGKQKADNPAPCRQVNIADGYAVLKDRNGALQFLLLPVVKVSGIESQKLLNPATPNYLAEAWRARHFMEMVLGKKIDDRNYALAVNSQLGRTQNQLHIHISCLRPDIRQRLDALSPQLNAKWQSFSVGAHNYLLRIITRDEFKRTSPFIRLANEVPGAREQMGHYGMAVAAMEDDKRVLMVLERNLLRLNFASAEELQDHTCALLK